jgi:asparagine synthase (glutamine-hydrolysing)
MCGFAGFWSPHGGRGDAAILRDMTDSIAHRGPDDDGAWCDDARGVFVGFRRLSILDLSPLGHQPMASANERYQITFNGEIYNHLEIRAELEALGERLRGHSDTEVLLAAIVRWGLPRTLARCAGMFAIALWDRETNTMSFVRDRFGEKPLYYTQIDGTLIYGSELKALRCHPRWRGTIDRSALALYFRHNYMPAPWTIYEGVRKVVPGTIVRITGEPDAAPVTTAYWSSRDAALAGTANPLEGSDDEIIGDMEAVLRRTIRQEMVADVPLGAFLSGGIDSSLVVALMQSESAQPVRTFTIGFHEKEFNEAEHARAVATHLGTDHTEAYVSPEEARSVIPRLPTLYDEPFADSSQIPTFLVAALARQHVTVSLSGDGGDELFAGYGRYAALRSAWDRLEKVPLAARSIAGRGLAQLASSRTAAVLAHVRPFLPARAARALAPDSLHRMAAALGASSPELVYRELVSYWSRPANLVLGATEASSMLSDPQHWAPLDDAVKSAMYLDTVSYLPDDILVKVDRATMGVSLESRAPLIDHRVAEFAWRVPHRLKVRNGQQKWILRQILYKQVPSALIDRPKMGFGVPIGEWLRGSLREWAEHLLAPDRIKREGLLDPAIVAATWAEHLAGRDRSAQLWGMLMFQAWLDAQAESRPCRPEDVPARPAPAGAGA